jgi:xanthine dehydrogenase YagS FAD-binding subunit
MNRFELARPTSLAAALNLAGDRPGSLWKAGGIDLLDHLKERLLEPPRLVDLKSVPGLDAVEVAADGRVRVGPLVTLARIAAHPGLRSTHAALVLACGEAASPQIRNVATLGGNLLQRPRCWYYRLASYRCFKKGGDTCFALGGENRYHVIFGSGACNAPHPSNAAMGLCALDASLVFQGKRGVRTVPAVKFFTIPGSDPQRENAKEPGEILTAIQLPAQRGMHSVYASVKEKAAFDWPLVSTAVALRLEGGIVLQARVVLGAVATVPIRSAAAEQALLGKSLDDRTGEAAAQAAVASAKPLSDNSYKVELLRTLIRRALRSFT